MTRKPFAFATLLAAVALLVGQYSPAQAQSASTYIYDCSWASLAGSTLLFNVRGQNLGGSASGFFGASGPGWTSKGIFTSESDYVDAFGEHVEIMGDVMFSHIVNSVRADFIAAKAIFHGVRMADGSQWEGVEIMDAAGNVLSSTGRDMNGQIVMYPLERGSLNIFH